MPGADVLAGTYQKLRDIYRSAYSWEPPKQPLLASPDKSMRVHVRRWINEWDIQRIYHAEPETEVEQIATDYSEDQELEKEREQSDSDSSAGEDRI
jgi:hypothetical protein